MNTNLILMTDSYKASHWLQYPAGTQSVFSYIESRGGKWDETVFFGLQAFIKEYLSRKITAEDIDEAEAVFTAHGEPFNREGWEIILNEYEGRIPLAISAVPEGTIVPTGNFLVGVWNTDTRLFWLPSYFETAILRAVWYGTTVATNSFQSKKVIWDYLVKTADDPAAEISFKMHDFGARGVSSAETAGLGGAAHLVNFMGTDTVEGLVAARRYYGADMAGFSIPAAEHSTITSWGGPSKEVDAFRNMLTQFAKPGSLVGVVSDSYDIYNAASKLWGEELLEEVKSSGATVVVRPDSGDPTQVPIDVIELLMEKVGYTVNSKGYKVLPSYFRVIQGDGINVQSIKAILSKMEERGLSASNIAFGQGAGLLQQVDRDTLKFAMKCSAININGTWQDVYKDPVTDSGKRSKRGLLDLYQKETGEYVTLRSTEALKDAFLTPVNGLVYTVVKGCGEVLRGSKYETFDEIRERANKPFVV